MTTTGLLFLLISWGSIVGLTAFCLYRIAAVPRRRHSRGPARSDDEPRS